MDLSGNSLTSGMDYALRLVELEEEMTEALETMPEVDSTNNPWDDDGWREFKGQASQFALDKVKAKIAEGAALDDEIANALDDIFPDRGVLRVGAKRGTHLLLRLAPVIGQGVQTYDIVRYVLLGGQNPQEQNVELVVALVNAVADTAVEHWNGILGLATRRVNENSTNVCMLNHFTTNNNFVNDLAPYAQPYFQSDNENQWEACWCVYSEDEYKGVYNQDWDEETKLAACCHHLANNPRLLPNP